MDVSTLPTMEPAIVATIACIRRLRTELADATVSEQTRTIAQKALADIAAKVTADRQFIQGLQPFTRVLPAAEQSRCSAQLRLLVLLEHELTGQHDATAN